MTRPYPVQNDLRTCHVSRGRFPTMRNGLHFVPLRAQFDARLWWETGACVHSEVVFPDGVDCGLPQAQSTSREKLAGRRTPRARRTASRVEGGTAILARSRNPRALAKSNNLHTRVETTRPPHAAPLSVACPPPHPLSPRRPPRHVRRENHRRRSGGRHGWP